MVIQIDANYMSVTTAAVGHPHCHGYRTDSGLQTFRAWPNVKARQDSH